MDDHYLSLVLAYIRLVLCTQPAGNNGYLREIQIRICKRLLTRCTARPGMLCDHTHPCFLCVFYTHHAQAASRRPLTEEVWVQSSCSRSGICGGESDTGMTSRVT